MDEANREPASPLTRPDDSGLSLEQLSQAYAQLLGGDDPYSVPPGEDPAAADDDLSADEILAAADRADESCELNPRSILEAMLFVGHPENRPLTSRYVAALMRGVRPQEIDELVVDLNAGYDAHRCPYRIASVGEGYRLELRPEFARLRDKFYGRVRAARLSQAAVDVLAIVAYNQPVTREGVEQLRAKPSGSLLTQLVRRQLLRIERPPEAPRQPRYSTTDRFLELFHLENLQDLPRPEA